MRWTKPIKRLLIALQLSGLLAWVADAYAFEALDDQQLDKVVAGSQIESDDETIIRIPLYSEKRYGKVKGEAIVMPAISKQTSGTLTIQDSAQSNLSSVININAVNSPIQVLLNLNVNINSQVGELKQYNIQPDLKWKKP